MLKLMNNLMEMKANVACGEICMQYAEAMSERNYEEAGRLVASMLMITSAASLLKNAAKPPSPDEIVACSRLALDNEVALMRSLEYSDVSN